MECSAITASMSIGMQHATQEIIRQDLHVVADISGVLPRQLSSTPSTIKACERHAAVVHSAENFPRVATAGLRYDHPLPRERS
jgi:hypothetical protein